MSILAIQINNKKYRLKRYDKENYDIQELIGKVWNTIDNFGKIYNNPRPWGYMGYSFATPGLAFNHFINQLSRIEISANKS